MQTINLHKVYMVLNLKNICTLLTHIGFTNAWSFPQKTWDTLYQLISKTTQRKVGRRRETFCITFFSYFLFYLNKVCNKQMYFSKEKLLASQLVFPNSNGLGCAIPHLDVHRNSLLNFTFIQYRGKTQHSHIVNLTQVR